MLGSALSPSSGVDAILRDFSILCTNWTIALRPFQDSLFFSLASVYFVFSLHKAIIKKADGLEVLIILCTQIIKIWFFHTLMISGPTWLGMLIRDFSTIGSKITGVHALSPGSLLEQGLKISLLVLNYDFEKGILESLSIAIISSFASLGILLSYLTMSTYMLLLLATATLVLGPGSIVLVFTATSWTIGMLKGYLDFVFNVAVKIFVIYLVLALSKNYGTEIAKGLEGLPTKDALENVLYATGVTALLAVLTVMLPNVASSVTTGVVSLKNEDLYYSINRAVMSVRNVIRPTAGSARTVGSAVRNSSLKVYDMATTVGMQKRKPEGVRKL